MTTVVVKFGGTSVADAAAIRAAAARIGSYRQNGRDVVAVVSAMGHTTDHLVALADEISSSPPKREMDMLLATGEQVSIALLAMALDDSGVPAVSFTGLQVGFRTSPDHTRARVEGIDTERIQRQLAAGRVVVVAGFQGVTEEGQITTLGRGGSDTTAVAIAAALGADSCEIFTDVDGVYTADPRIVPDARKLDRISHMEMLELAILGAGVMHDRAVLFGQRYGVPIHVRHSRKDDPGTVIVKESPDMEHSAVVGCALKANIGRVSLLNLPRTPGIQSRIFEAIAEAHVFVDDIIQTETENTVNISFTLEDRDLADVKPTMERVIREIGQGEMTIDIGLSKVSVVGLGMRTHTGVAAKMFAVLGNAGINISNITTSEIKISCILNRPDGENALRLVHDAFELAGEPQQEESAGTGEAAPCQ